MSKKLFIDRVELPRLWLRLGSLNSQTVGTLVLKGKPSLESLQGLKKAWDNVLGRDPLLFLDIGSKK